MKDLNDYQLIDLEEKLNRAQREFAVLYEVSNAMRTTLELDHILHIILTGVTAHTGLQFNRAILFLVNDTDRCLEPKMAIGPESGEDAQRIWEYISTTNEHLDDLIEEDRIKQNRDRSSLYNTVKSLKIPLSAINDSVLARAYQTGNHLILREADIKEHQQDQLFSVLKTTELIIMPLKAKDTVNGIIIADNIFTKKPITDDDVRIFTMIANQAGLAIENSKLYELTMHKSHTDAITGLWNHGFFQNQLTHEVVQAKTTKQPLSLMIIDIDNFKKLNDTYGHQNGDIVLKDIANVILESSRTTDYVCRYGGEEFSVILTQTTKEQGYAIAERVRQRVAQRQFPNFSLYDNVVVTVSVGLSTFPLDAENKEQLIAKADKAMYCAKFSGKNQTCVAE